MPGDQVRFAAESILRGTTPSSLPKTYGQGSPQRVSFISYIPPPWRLLPSISFISPSTLKLVPAGIVTSYSFGIAEACSYRGRQSSR